MNKLWKIVAGSIALIVVIVVGLIVAVALILEPEDYRPLIVKTVQQSTGRSFTMEGNLGLKLFPCCAIAIGPSTLGNPAGFPGQQFAKVDAAALSVKIWPLITRREVQIGTLSVDGLDLALIQLADGRGNWEFETAEPATESEDSGEALSIEELLVRNGRVSYRDLGTQAAYTVSDLRLRTGTIGPDLAFDLDTTLTVTDESAGTSGSLSLAAAVSLGDPSRLAARNLSVDFEIPRIEGEAVNIKGRGTVAAIEFDSEHSTGSLTALETDVEGPGIRAHLSGGGQFGAPDAQLQGTLELRDASPRELLAKFADDPFVPADARAMNRLAGTMRWVVNENSAALQNIQLKLDDSQLTGSAALADLDSGAVQFDLAIDDIDLDRYLPEQTKAAASGPAEPTTLPLADLRGLAVTGELSIGRLRAAKVDLNAVALSLEVSGDKVALTLGGRPPGGSFKLDGTGNVAAADPFVSGKLTLTDLSPRNLLAAQGEALETADPNALSRLSGTARWRLASRAAALEDMSWQLDQTRISGNLHVDDLDRLKTRFDLSLDRLNLDGYLSPDETGAGESATEIPVSTIRDLDLTGRMRAQQLTVAKLTLQNVIADVRAADGVVRLAPVQADLYGGKYEGSIAIDATGPRAQLALEQQVTAVQVGDMLRTVYDTDRLVGSLSMQLNATGKGNTQADLLKQLGGDFSLNLSDGVYRGVDIPYEISRARSLLRKEAAPEAPAQQQTPIRALALTGKLIDGVLQSNDLNAEIPFMRLAGKGGLNLLARTLDYQLNAQILKKAGAGGENLSDLVDANIPLTIKGSALSPKVSVDMKNLVMTTVKERARDALLERIGISSSTPAPVADKAPNAATEVAPTQQATQPATAGEPVAAAQPGSEEKPEEQPTPEETPPKEKPEDLLKRGLRELLKRQQSP